MQLDPKKLTPMPGYVLVEPAEKATQTAGGIYLPDNASDKPQAGTVIAVGESIWESGVKEVKSPVKVGDAVVYKKWGGNDVKMGTIEYQFLKFEDILAVIK
ncbi:MAG: 10 kDa chaperonin [Microgenomates group bacterium GW2011_GWC2_46_7]|nr:MAG: 10 kDa chaperonin [Microgenomates group bacterium GW2011_GWC2_46_7]